MTIMLKYQEVYGNIIRLCQYANVTYYEKFKFKARITESTPVDSNAKDLEIAVH